MGEASGRENGSRHPRSDSRESGERSDNETDLRVLTLATNNQVRRRSTDGGGDLRYHSNTENRWSPGCRDFRRSDRRRSPRPRARYGNRPSPHSPIRKRSRYDGPLPTRSSEDSFRASDIYVSRSNFRPGGQLSCLEPSSRGHSSGPSSNQSLGRNNYRGEDYRDDYNSRGYNRGYGSMERSRPSSLEFRGPRDHRENRPVDYSVYRGYSSSNAAHGPRSSRHAILQVNSSHQDNSKVDLVESRSNHRRDARAPPTASTMPKISQQKNGAEPAEPVAVPAQSAPSGAPSQVTGDPPKERPNFEPSNLLAAETNTKNGVYVKYAEPIDSRMPVHHWRVYVFKDGQEKEHSVVHLHRQASYLIGCDKRVADIPAMHPSVSKQHAVIQFRHVRGGEVKPYIIDLESTNGTTLNGESLKTSRYYELLNGDVVRFGVSSREYVFMRNDAATEGTDHRKTITYQQIAEQHINKKRLALQQKKNDDVKTISES